EAEHCDRLAILNQGKVVGLGTPAELRSQIGGDVVWFDSAEPSDLADAIAQRFQGRPQLIAGRLRLEREHGHRFVAEGADAFPEKVRAASVSQPSLEDVFIDKTGHKFWSDDTSAPASE